MMGKRIVGICLVGILAAGVCCGQSIPAVKAKSLDDSEVILPKPGGAQVLILIVGFSHKSSDEAGVWSKRVAADYRENARVAYYQIAELQAAPGFVRGMILHGMKKKTAPAEQGHFVPIYDHAEEWKKLVNFLVPDDAYLIVATTEGKAVWQGHGAFSESVYAEMKKAVGDAVNLGERKN